MSDPFVAEIRIAAFNFAPTGWAFCDGQILSISQNTALFSLLGTTYGGNGTSNFALPNLQDSAPLQPGQGPGLSLRDLGETGGEAAVALLPSELPAHSHAVTASSAVGTDPGPAGDTWGAPSIARGQHLYAATDATTQMSPAATATAGGGLPHDNMPPYLTLNFIVALQGIFPPRS